MLGDFGDRPLWRIFSGAMKPLFSLSPSFSFYLFGADRFFVAYQRIRSKAPIERSELLIKVSAPFLLVHDLFVSSVNSILPEPEAGLGVGVLLGGKNVLSKSFRIF